MAHKRKTEVNMTLLLSARFIPSYSQDWEKKNQKKFPNAIHSLFPEFQVVASILG
jgi:hypothetical protein